uniref:Secreted protein n=1 Tax=Ixodes ricinus TaxID=34613 RepID=A0A6B0V2J8_IXORI
MSTAAFFFSLAPRSACAASDAPSASVAASSSGVPRVAACSEPGLRGRVAWVASSWQSRLYLSRPSSRWASSSSWRLSSSCRCRCRASTSCCSDIIWSSLRLRQFCAATLFLPRLRMSLISASCASVSSNLARRSLNSSMGSSTISTLVRGRLRARARFSSRDARSWSWRSRSASPSSQPPSSSSSSDVLPSSAVDEAASAAE